LKTIIIIPVHNEEAYISRMLDSIVRQTVKPDLVLIVNDSSTDDSENIIDQYTSKFVFIKSTHNVSEATHIPGAKIINAFYKGYETLEEDFDLIGKFDADIILPLDYFEKMQLLFKENPKVGIAGGNLYIKSLQGWTFEAISEKTKVRGPIKLYRKECFQDIGGLKKSIGWDTVDGMLAQFHHWTIATDTTAHVKHLKPTGEKYIKTALFKQGEAFYKMRYSKTLARIAASKLALAKNNFASYFSCMRGYNAAKYSSMEQIVTEEEGKFINTTRWQGIKKKIL
jgi:hypothetical protein